MFEAMDTKTLINTRFSYSQLGDVEMAKACEVEIDRRLSARLAERLVA